MAQPEFAIMTALTAETLRRLTRLWVTLWGSVSVLPSEASPSAPGQSARRRAEEQSPGPGRRAGAHATDPARKTAGDVPAIDFPQVWTDAVDESVQDVIDAMDAAADSVAREVPAANTQRAKAFRSARVRAALAPSSVAKRGFFAVTEALAQPEMLTKDVRGVVVGELVADHTDEMRDKAIDLGDEWVTIWVAERDACVRCLAYQGLWVTPAAAQLFPGGRTWGPRWKSVISRPDFRGPGWRETESGEHEGSHPHCRCELRVVRRTNVHLLAAGLKREATRSAAKGWARPTEGDSVRVAAAKHALNSAIVLPKTVTAEARRRLGKPDGFARAVPSPSR